MNEKIFPSGRRPVPKTSADSASKSLVQRIHEAYDRLPSREVRVADLLVQDPAGLAVQTATEVAQRAEVSNATVTRFFRRLGYDSFDAARQAARRLLSEGSPLARSSRAGPDGAFLPAILNEDIAVLEATLTAINPLTLREIAAALAGARRVGIAGFRNSEALAQYLAAGLSQLRPDNALMPAPAQSMAEAMAQLGPDDVVVLVGLRRRPAGFTDLARVAAGTGASLLLITDPSVRSAPAHARWTLTCSVDTGHPFDSYVGATALLRVLILSVARHTAQRGETHLERIEAYHQRLSDLE